MGLISEIEAAEAKVKEDAVKIVDDLEKKKAEAVKIVSDAREVAKDAEKDAPEVAAEAEKVLPDAEKALDVAEEVAPDEEKPVFVALSRIVTRLNGVLTVYEEGEPVMPAENGAVLRSRGEPVALITSVKGSKAKDNALTPAQRLRRDIEQSLEYSRAKANR